MPRGGAGPPSRAGLRDLYYGDGGRVSRDPRVPYGRRLAGGDVLMPAAEGAGLNCFALSTRAEDSPFGAPRRRITSQLIVEEFERLPPPVREMPVVVSDEARVHASRRVRGRRPFRQRRG